MVGCTVWAWRWRWAGRAGGARAHQRSDGRGRPRLASRGSARGLLGGSLEQCRREPWGLLQCRICRSAGRAMVRAPSEAPSQAHSLRPAHSGVGTSGSPARERARLLSKTLRDPRKSLVCNTLQCGFQSWVIADDASDILSTSSSTFLRLYTEKWDFQRPILRLTLPPAAHTRSALRPHLIRSRPAFSDESRPCRCAAC